MKRLYLKDCEPGDVVDAVFVLTGKQLSATTSGKPFIKAFVSDNSAQVTARMWNASREIFARLPENGFARIRGKIENYQGNLQFIIEQIAPAEVGSYDLTELIPHTSKDIDGMCQRVFELCESIQNRHLAAIIQAFLDDEDLINNFAKAPAASSFHHAYIGGLLEHTLNAMEAAERLIPLYPGLNRDLVIAGIFLHDIAKTWELTYDCGFGYSDSGQLVGHIVKAAIWIEQKARIASKLLGETIPKALVDVLQHIILAHHGLPEFGAARVPSTPEAVAVHLIENMDAKLMMALTATRGPAAEGAEGNWTDYLKPFSGRLYRPDVAPQQAEFAGEPAGAVPATPMPTGATGPATQRAAASRTGPAPAPPTAPLPSGSTTAGPRSDAATPAAGVKITNPLFESAPKRGK